MYIVILTCAAGSETLQVFENVVLYLCLVLQADFSSNGRMFKINSNDEFRTTTFHRWKYSHYFKVVEKRVRL